MSLLWRSCLVTTLIMSCIATTRSFKNTMEASKVRHDYTEDDFLYARRGPCDVEQRRDTIPLEEGSPLGSALPITLTFPRRQEKQIDLHHQERKNSLLPVLFFFNGFKMRSSWYRDVVERLSSWGYVVFQYDTPFLKLPSVAAELDVFPKLVLWLKNHFGKQNHSIIIDGKPDVDSIAVIGHSRGGKLAALAYAGNRNLVKTAWLLDPVDETSYAPESEEEPLASKAIKSNNITLGITGAGIISSCSPLVRGIPQYNELFGCAASSSWEIVVPGASHATFLNAGKIRNWICDILCHKGILSRQAMVPLTTAPILTWMEDIFLNDTSMINKYYSQKYTVELGIESRGRKSSRIKQLKAWLEKQQIEFRIKSSLSDMIGNLENKSIDKYRNYPS